MNRAPWILAAVCAIGLVLGWWLMGVLVAKPDERPALVQRIPSLPPFAELPSLAKGSHPIIDTLASPGSTVWLLLDRSPQGSPALVCGFPRRSAGDVDAPRCFHPAPALATRVGQARFAFGGSEPIVILPDSESPVGAVALNARTGDSSKVVREGSLLSVDTDRGTRLVRHFEVSRSGALVQQSPSEGAYVGPVSGYAATRAPTLEPGDTPERTSSCITPAGYIQAHRATAIRGAAGPAARRAVEVRFYSRGDRVATSSGLLPANPLIEAEFACKPTSALFTWLEATGSLSQLACSPEDCEPKTVEQTDLAKIEPLSLALAGDSIVVLWRDRTGVPLIRLGPLAGFARSPTAPLWKAAPPRGREPNFTLARTIATGRSLIVLVQAADLKAIQIHADGKLEALAPLKASASND